MTARAPKKPRAKPKVGLDKPCQQCGQPIYFNYRGPVEGICGRCADRALAAHRSPGRVRTRLIAKQYGRSTFWISVVLAFLLGAIASRVLQVLLPF